MDKNAILSSVEFFLGHSVEKKDFLPVFLLLVIYFIKSGTKKRVYKYYCDLILFYMKVNHRKS